MKKSVQLRTEIFSTRVIFLTVGVMIAAWAPLVPLAKVRVGVDDGQLGLMLLGLGIGGLITMPLTGPMTALWGYRRVILSMFCLSIVVLPFLAMLDTFWAMTLALVLYGGAIGSTDVAMNLQAAEVEKKSGRPLMSNFHGMWSVGAFVGSAGMSALLALRVDPVLAAVGISLASFVVTLLIVPGLLPKQARPVEEPLFVIPKGSVIALGVICFAVYLSEHAVLDWSAVYLTSVLGATTGSAGFGYAIFAAMMTGGRFAGDWARGRLGDTHVYVLGGLLASCGYLLVAASPTVVLSYVGFAMVGLGLSNLVPILFSAAGRARAMPPHLALTAVATVAHGGLLLGPAIVGFVSVATSLTMAFMFLGGIIFLVTLSYRRLAAV